MYLTRFAKKIYLVHRRNELRADKIVQERLKQCDKIEILYSTTVKEIHGEEKVNSVTLCDMTTNECSELKTDGVFPYLEHHRLQKLRQ